MLTKHLYSTVLFPIYDLVYVPARLSENMVHVLCECIYVVSRKVNYECGLK